ncbi:type IV secretion system protein [Vibrio scophthalmi]|uniref:TrbL/VirB6 plasmid conjugal transfer protein n=1 Tax=Vibrio scophthalmi LMG 19158 TaxID=870967 RepID=F9RNA1_9VIBR|nr:type IV secretion system protein [Vibrio scophthalmi]EGU37246.1 hypothetical protein VIS19158_03527 [Vibrio scophthalmi LMG 19158]
MSKSNDIFRDNFATYINEFVEALMANSEMNSFLIMFATFLIVVLAFIEISKFMLIGFELESVAQSILMVFFTLILMKGFPAAFDVAHQTFDKLGLLILRIGTGNEDVFFLSKWINKYLNYINGGEDSSILSMSVLDVVFALIWQLIALLLQAAMFLVATWATWTLALAKMIGLFFIPCLILPATRPLFDGWMQFTVASLLLLVILRAVGVLVALSIKAQFVSIGLLTCQNGQAWESCTVVQRAGFGLSIGQLIGLIVSMAIAILLVAASIGITGQIAGGITSPSKSISKGMGNMAGKMAGSVTGKALSKIFSKLK